MNRGYKICFIIYAVVLVFSILFMLVLIGASGHNYKFTARHFLVAVYAISSISSLVIYPRISTKKKVLKRSVGLITTGLLGISLFFAIQNLIIIFSEDLIIGFRIFSSLIATLFCIAVVILVLEILRQEKTTANKGFTP